MRIWAWANGGTDLIGQWNGQIPEMHSFLSTGEKRWQVVAVTYCIDICTKECTGVELKVREVDS